MDALRTLSSEVTIDKARTNLPMNSSENGWRLYLLYKIRSADLPDAEANQGQAKRVTRISLTLTSTTSLLMNKNQWFQ